MRWLTLAGDRPPRVLLGGGSFPCRVGVVPVRAVSPFASGGGALAWSDTVVQFLEDGGRYKDMIVALHHGILDNRRLVVEPTAAYIEDL